MSGNDNKATAMRFTEEFKNAGTIDNLDDILSSDFVHHFALPGLPPGVDGAKAVGQAVFGAFPDVTAKVEFMISDGDTVAERVVVSATHTGEFMGIPATGKKVQWTENNLYRVADGKIVETWSEGSLGAMMQQIQGEG